MRRGPARACWGCETALSVVVHDDGRDRAAGLARRRPGDDASGPPRSSDCADQGRPIAVGEPANLVLVDPDATWTVRGAAAGEPRANTPYEGMRLPAHGGRDGPARSDHGARRTGRPWTQDAPGRSRDDAPQCWCSRTAGSSAARRTAPSGETFGEAVFTTGMTGYQETLTDPSYHRPDRRRRPRRRSATPAVNDEDDESARIQVAGYVVRDPSRTRVELARHARSLDDELDRRRGSSASRASTPGR